VSDASLTSPITRLPGMRMGSPGSGAASHRVALWVSESVLPANLTFNGDEDLRPEGFIPVFSSNCSESPFPSRFSVLRHPRAFNPDFGLIGWNALISGTHTRAPEGINGPA
jgi:hypothetical protein